MTAEPHARPPADSRMVLYRMARQAAFIVIVVLIVKIILFDIVTVRGDQMAPSIIRGDRLLSLRLPYLPVLPSSFGRSRGTAVLFTFPAGQKLFPGLGGQRGFLRIAGISGDTVAVDSGVFRNSRLKSDKPFRSGGSIPGDIVPADYSSRDFLDPMRIPSPGDTVRLDSADLTRFFWNVSVIRQENPSSNFSLKTQIAFNDTVVPDFRLIDFALYKGPIDSLPESLRFDWFFWKRLKEYLRQSSGNQAVTLSFALYKDTIRLTKYTVQRRYLFLLADNWKAGLDSRYFGPIAASRVFARPLFTVWSYAKPGGLRLARLGRIVR
jgi:signal peptidase I